MAGVIVMRDGSVVIAPRQHAPLSMAQNAMDKATVIALVSIQQMVMVAGVYASIHSLVQIAHGNIALGRPPNSVR